jgi:hypothetical protein
MYIWTGPTAMIAKCANPMCSSIFRYLHEGKVYVLHCHESSNDWSSRANFCGLLRNAQYAWLCDRCAKEMSVILDFENRIKVIPEVWHVRVGA